MTRSRLGMGAFLLGAVGTGAIMAYALRHASAFQDDYVYIAVARHLDSPWVLLTQDSVGSYFFRPLAMLFWWASAALFGESAPAHHALGMAVHVANGLLLHGLLRRLGASAAVAALVALGFIAHPASISTASWLSDRFDLLATCFGLAALLAIERHLERPTLTCLVAAAAALLASILCKEIGFAIAAAGLVAIAWTDSRRHAASRAWRWALAGAIAVTVLAALAMRTLALRPVPDTEGLLGILLGMLATGTGKWSLALPAFLFVEAGRLLSLVAWVLTAAMLVVLAALPRSRAALAGGGLARMAVLGLALMLLGAAVQAPTLSNAPLLTFSRESFSPGAVVTARFYYLPLAGFALLVAALAEAAMRSQRPRAATWILVALTVCTLVGFLATSRAITRQWAHFTAERNVHAQAAIETVTALTRLQPGCKIYLLDTPAGADLFRDMADTAVKKSLPRDHSALACFIQAEHAPWYHLLARGNLPPDAERPFEIIEAGGRPYPPLPLGNLVYYFVRIVAGDAVLDDPRATFFAYRDGRFVDVTSEVRARKRVPRFFDRRAP
jgi:hypothetical protein